jgi:hypothetical protein
VIAALTRPVARPLLRTADDDRRRLTRPSAGLQKVLRAADRLPGHEPSRRHNITVSHSHRLVWFRVAKVGTRSIFATLRAAGVDLDLEEPFGINAPRALTPGYVRAAFVRHPLDRFLSAWQSTVCKLNHFDFAPDEHEAMKDIGTFIEWFVAQDASTCDPHLRLQSALVPDDGVDLLGRMETFDRDVARLLDLIGAHHPGPSRANASPTAPPALTPAQRAVLVDVYRPDLDRFGYLDRFGHEVP